MICVVSPHMTMLVFADAVCGRLVWRMFEAWRFIAILVNILVGSRCKSARYNQTLMLMYVLMYVNGENREFSVACKRRGKCLEGVLKGTWKKKISVWS